MKNNKKINIKPGFVGFAGLLVTSASILGLFAHEPIENKLVLAAFVSTLILGVMLVVAGFASSVTNKEEPETLIQGQNLYPTAPPPEYSANCGR